MAGFWVIRWIGFPRGSIIGLNLVSLGENKIISVSTILIIPALIIILTGILQRLVFDIQLLD